MTAINAGIGASVALAFFVVFGTLLLVQIRGDSWLPAWVPKSARRRSDNRAIRIFGIIWCAAWSLGGQAVIVVQGFRQIDLGNRDAGVIYLIEAAMAGVVALIGLWLVRPQPAGPIRGSRH
jgi:hypothetical protein